MAVEISFDFNKKAISPSTIKLLETKLVEACEKEWLQTVFKGNVLKKADANQLVNSILAAIEIFQPNSEEEFEDDESLSQALKLRLKAQGENDEVSA